MLNFGSISLVAFWQWKKTNGNHYWALGTSGRWFGCRANLRGPALPGEVVSGELVGDRLENVRITQPSEHRIAGKL